MLNVLHPSAGDPTNSIFRFFSKCAVAALEDMCGWLMEESGEVAVYDATNTTYLRRQMIYETVVEKYGFKLFFVESVCNDPGIIEANIRASLSTSVDLTYVNASALMVGIFFLFLFVVDFFFVGTQNFAGSENSQPRLHRHGAGRGAVRFHQAHRALQVDIPDAGRGHRKSLLVHTNFQRRRESARASPRRPHSVACRLLSDEHTHHSALDLSD